MKKNIIILICLFSIITSCGYNSIYSSKKNYSFNIIDLKIIGDRKINSRIKNNLINISNSESLNEYALKINSIKETSIATKDAKGNAKIYNLKIVVTIKVFNEEELIGEKILQETFNYANSNNKFDLKQYEKNILNNLSDKVIDNIVVYLLSL